MGQTASAQPSLDHSNGDVFENRETSGQVQVKPKKRVQIQECEPVTIIVEPDYTISDGGTQAIHENHEETKEEGGGKESTIQVEKYETASELINVEATTTAVENVVVAQSESEVIQVVELCCPEFEEAEAESLEYVELFPVGERDDNEIVWNPPAKVEAEETQLTTVAEDHNITALANAKWEARRQLYREAYSQDMRNTSGSVGTDISSPEGSISVSSYLYAQQCDATELLMDLGFGGIDSAVNIPERFVASKIVSKRLDSASTRSIDEDEDDHESISASMHSYPSTWSDHNSLYDRIPVRFLPSVSLSGSLSDSDSDELDKTMVTSVPIILEPEDVADDSFDLMRHLRLNRGPSKPLRDGVFLEPVTEELEVSSVGSASERTKISAKQESLDSLGTVLTKISRKQESSDTENVIFEQNEKTHGSPLSGLGNSQSLDLPAEDINETCPEMEGPFNSSLENVTAEVGVKGTPSSLGDSESGVGSSICTGEQESPTGRVLPLRKTYLNTLLSDTVQESFELEEIATEESYNVNEAGDEDISGMGEERGRTGTVVENRKQLRRESSDESSGFEDGEVNEKLKSQIPDIQVISVDEVAMSDPGKTSHELVDVEARRAAFSKRRSWSGTKQRRVVFEDEVQRPKAYSLDSSPTELHPGVEWNAKGSKEMRVGTHSGEDKVTLNLQSVDINQESLVRAEKGKTITELECTYDTEPTLPSTKVDEQQEILQRKPAKATIQQSSQKTEKIDAQRTLNNNVGVAVESLKDDLEKTPLLGQTSKDESESLPYKKASDYRRVSSVRNFFARVLSTRRRNSDGVKLRTHRFQTLKDISGPAPCVKETKKHDSMQLVQPNQRLRRCLDDLDIVEVKLFKYQTTFSAMESLSTFQRRYYSRKLFARLAWDISMIRQLRSLIKQQIAEMETNLRKRRTLLQENITTENLPNGVTEKVGTLLAKQTTLRSFLVDLSNDVCGRWHDEDYSPIRPNQRELETQIKKSILDELNQTFFNQIYELRQEVRAKDAVINDLKISIQRIEKRTESQSKL